MPRFLKNYFSFFFISLFFTLLSLFSPSSIFAQGGAPCGTTTITYTKYTCGCLTDADGNQYNCQCNGSPYTYTNAVCTNVGSGCRISGTYNLSNVCSVTGGGSGCNINDAESQFPCTPAATATPVPSCGNGTCGGNENCSSCPADCGACPGATATPVPPSGGCTNGSCHDNSLAADGFINNCGEIGKAEGAGTCSNGRCCTNPGAPPPPACKPPGVVNTLLWCNSNPQDACQGITCCTGSCSTFNTDDNGLCGKPGCNYPQCGQKVATCPAPTPTPNPATIKARTKVITNDDISCAAINASSSYAVPTVFTLTPGGNRTQASSAYAVWSQTTATFSLASSPPAGYVLQNSCWVRTAPNPTSGTGLTAAANAGATLTWDLGYTLGTPWIQTQGGDVLIKDSVSSRMTSLASPRLFSVNGDGGYPGNVMYGSTQAAPYNFNAATDVTYGRDYVSSTNWLANEPGDGTNKDPYVVDWYKYFLYQLDLSPESGATADYSLPLNTITKPTSPSRQALTYAYLVTGDMETSGDWTIGANETIVFFVSGNATIKGKINITPGGFFALIANGNIAVNPTVGVAATSSTPVVEGFYITSKAGSFQTGASSNAGTERFVGKGSFIAGSFLLQRDLVSVSANQTTSAELFIYNPQLLFTMPLKMQDMKIRWQEVAP